MSNCLLKMAESKYEWCVVCECEKASPTAQFTHSGDKTTVCFQPLVFPSILPTVWLTAECEFR